MQAKAPGLRSGIGFDAHELVPGRRLVLGGVQLSHNKGLAGHSDADVLLHAVTDALLGALALPDIGTRFPDTDPALEGADSARFLKDVLADVTRLGFVVLNVDCVLVCDAPKLAPRAASIRESLARLLGIDPDRVGLKAKTTEGTLLARPGASIAALCVALLGQRDAV